jgi:hypothetical protein
MNFIDLLYPSDYTRPWGVQRRRRVSLTTSPPSVNRFENSALRRIFGVERDEMTGGYGEQHNEELRDICSWPGIVRMIKSRSM